MLYFNSSLNNLTASINDLKKQQQILNKNSEKNNTDIKKDLYYISNKINVTWDCYNSSLAVNKRSKSSQNYDSNIEISDFIDCKDNDKDYSFPGKCIIKNVLNRESSVNYFDNNQGFNCFSSKEVKDINTQVRKICSKKNLSEKQLIILFNNNIHNTSITNNASIVNINNKNIGGAYNANNSSFNNNTVIHGNKHSLDSNINRKQLNKNSSSRVNKSTISPTKNNADYINKNTTTNNNIINNTNINSNSSSTKIANTNYYSINNNINNNKQISEKNSLLTTEFYAYQETISALPEIEKQYLKTMKNLESLIASTDTYNNNNISKTPIKIKDIKANLTNNTIELKSIIRSLIFIKEKLKFNNSGLTEINRILNKEISDNSNTIKNYEKFCLNCHKMFNLNTKNKDEVSDTIIMQITIAIAIIVF